MYMSYDEFILDEKKRQSKVWKASAVRGMVQSFDDIYHIKVNIGGRGFRGDFGKIVNKR